MLRVLIVDDSPTARMGLRRVLESDPSILVIGEASDGRQAESIVRRRKPDLLTMDVHMGKEDGIEVAARLMSTRPVPILIVTGLDLEESDTAFRAMEAGALEVCPKPPGIHHEDYEAARRRLVRLVKTLARVPVVTRRSRSRRRRGVPTPRAVLSEAPSDAVKLVAIGASTGGPPVLHTLLGALPKPFPAPIAIVQHICEGFASGLASWLQAETGHEVGLCTERQRLRAGRVYLAPDAAHLRVANAREIAPFDGPPRSFQRPSIDELFESASEQLGGDVIAVLLTGMGRDGMDGMVKLAAQGAHTIAQQPSTCVVDSMPRSAILAGAARWTLAPPAIAATLEGLLVRGRSGARRPECDETNPLETPADAG